MDIRSALSRLTAIQQGLSITTPITASIKKAWTYFPPENAVVDTPCFLNSWTLVEEARNPSHRIQRYTVRMQLLVHDADMERAADIATSFHVQLVDALDADVNLAGTVSYQTLRGGNPTLAILERGGRIYVGLDLYLDLVMSEPRTFQLGS